MKKRIALIAAAIAALIACIVVAIVLIVINTGAHRHKFGDWTVYRDPTCLEYGLERRKCRGCDVFEERAVTRLGHAFDQDNVCTRCSYEIPVTEGLTYALSDDGSYYTVALGVTTETDIYLPRYHDDIPVDEVRSDGFTESAIKSVFIPDGIKRIEMRAFYHCTQLETCYYPITAERIANLAFSGCEKLESVELAPSAVIGNSAFSDCTSITQVEIPDGITMMDIAVFSGCTSLTSAVIGSGLSELPSGTFEGCTALVSVEIRDGTNAIGANAFSGCKALKSVTIHGNLKKIGAASFQSCEGLQEFRFGNTMAAWKALDKARDWLADLSETKDFRVYCTDGVLNRYEVEIVVDI